MTDDGPRWAYTHPKSPNDTMRWFAHPIVKVTEKLVYVSPKSIPALDVGTDREARDLDGKPLRCDRQQFENKGWVRHGSLRDGVFYRHPGMVGKETGDHGWLEDRWAVIESRYRELEAWHRELEAWKAGNPAAWAERQALADRVGRQRGIHSDDESG